MFLIQSLTGEELEEACDQQTAASPSRPETALARPRRSRPGGRGSSACSGSSPDWPAMPTCRWHLWIVLAAVGRLDLALVAYAVYFPLRRWLAACGRGWPMPEPRLSVLVVARNEAANLEGCLASARFADERVVVVDAASQDATLEIARRHAERVSVRAFDNFADQRNAALGLASGDWVLAIDADERVTPELAAEIRGRLADPRLACVGFRVPIRARSWAGRSGYSGTQQDNPLRLFRRDRGRWTGRVHETVAIEGPIGRMQRVLEHRTLPNVRVFLGKIDHYTTLEASDLYASRQEVPAQRPGAPAVLDVPQALPLQARVPRRCRGADVLRPLGAVGRGADLEAPRAEPGEGGVMISIP